jgi:hypothetical protein
MPYIDLKDVIVEVEAKMAIEYKLVTRIKALLDIISITSRDRKRSI